LGRRNEEGKKSRGRGEERKEKRVKRNYNEREKGQEE
jgi:hypothetical protein